jgi:nucleoid DNA-binding protein
MATVTKKDLALKIAEKTNENANVVQDIIQALFDEINCQLGRGNRIELRDFGVFSFKKRAARIGHNPRTLEKVDVSAKVIVTFKVGKNMKEAINRLSSQLSPEK